MAAIPSAVERFSDGKLARVKDATTTLIVIGAASAGPINTLIMFSDAAAAETAHGDGMGLIGLGELLAEGGPVGFIRCNTSNAGSVTAVTTSATSLVTVTGTPLYDFDKVVVEIVTTGVRGLGVGKFRYSLDAYQGDTAAERTYSEPILIPASTFVIPRSGLTLSFDEDTDPYTAGDSHTFSGKAASPNPTNITDACNAAKLAAVDWRTALIVTSADVTPAEHALIGAASEAVWVTAETLPKYREALLSSGGNVVADAAAVITSIAPLAHLHQAYLFGACRLTIARPFVGFAFAKVFSIVPAAGRVAKLLPSTDVKRVASGSLSRVVKIFHDELLEPTALDDFKIGTLRTWQGQEGAFVTQLRPKSNSGSDLEKWPDLTVLQMAREIAHASAVLQIGKNLRTETNKVGSTAYTGVVDARDRARIEAETNRQLRAQLVTVINEEGTEGYVQDVRYEISSTHDYASTKKLVGKIKLLKFESVDYVDTEVSFTAE